jgi:hypothetical protein
MDDNGTGEAKSAKPKCKNKNCGAASREFISNWGRRCYGFAGLVPSICGFSSNLKPQVSAVRNSDFVRGYFLQFKGRNL